MSEVVKTELRFCAGSSGEQLGTMIVEGKHDLSDPNKVRQLMELLNLPEGTTATVLATASSVVVR